MLRIMLPFAAAGQLRKPVTTADVGSLIRILYIFVIVVDVDVTVCPSAVVTPATTPCGSERNTSPEG